MDQPDIRNRYWQLRQEVYSAISRDSFDEAMASLSNINAILPKQHKIKCKSQIIGIVMNYIENSLQDDDILK